jgi:altronate dehydratase
MSSALLFDSVARLPDAGDNVAIAVRRLEQGESIEFGGQIFSLAATILEGHRFAVKRIATNEPLLSWKMPFGFAIRDIEPGEYVCNEKILWALRQRRVDFELPAAPNFKDYYVPFRLDESAFRPGKRVERYSNRLTFEGFRRPGNRGVGTRNFIAILGTTSRTAGYARALADRFRHIQKDFPNIDGVIAIAHTESGTESKPNNAEFVLRTLAGFMTHPNLGAVLAVDTGREFLNNARLREYMIEQGYSLDDVLHKFYSASGSFLSDLSEGEKIVRSWLPSVSQFSRTAESVEHLRIGLQCGGSDAFSGVSGNPLVGWVTKELVRYGGSANLAETDELIGAESYILANIRDLQTARAFLATIASFQERAGWHGHTGEGNPSGGNNFRGLYNIAVKSIGAARKKDPDVCVDYVIDYSIPMRSPGFYFMDSPGNDLESIAGQVGSGCNIILFTTGNGSITNFPFVPTIKVMTNTGRYNLLRHEMDVNAGRYLDGTPMDQLGRETFELMLKIASGERSIGEKAGHSQVQLWREWRQRDAARLQELLRRPKPDGVPIPLSRYARESAAPITVASQRDGNERIGLIVPTSLCAGQIGKLIADQLNSSKHAGFDRFVALAHTEGCGASSGECEEISLRTMAGYLCHPLVGRALLLEHGCEKTHNDAFREFCENNDIDYSRFGFASVQLDGGLERVTDKVVRWFDSHSPKSDGDAAGLRIGLTAEPGAPENLCSACARLARVIVEAGGTVVVPENAFLLQTKAFIEPLFGPAVPKASLAYGEHASREGFHIMQTPTDHAVETLTGLGATGTELIVVCVSKSVWQAHPMIPVLQVSSSALSEDLDLVVSPNESSGAIAERLLALVGQATNGQYSPRLFSRGNTDFQLTRGMLGVSL